MKKKYVDRRCLPACACVWMIMVVVAVVGKGTKAEHKGQRASDARVDWARLGDVWGETPWGVKVDAE